MGKSPRHNAVRDQLYLFALYGTPNAMKEARHPEFPLDSRRPADVLIPAFFENGHAACIDICVANPFTFGVRYDSPGAAAKHLISIKKRALQERTALPATWDHCVMAFETTGGLEKTGGKILAKIAENWVSRSRRGYSEIVNYIRRSLANIVVRETTNMVLRETSVERAPPCVRPSHLLALLQVAT